ncbi:DUF4907 domain-containing protein [Epilithonimonas caeni]|uniref:DUF4907 domain-containing protein n=1 Tax=Epilithonimonas caeni TaxID=365343 RepID=UPI00054F61AF|nr:DUF4907 domain-containing protein [Epilithonimonas caeni]
MKMIKTFWRSFLSVGILLISCEKKNNELDVKITQQENGFGYQIIKNKKVFIDQPFIPAVQGEQSFQDSLQARRTADLVIEKIGKTSFPRISVHELDSMKIEYEIPKFQ